MGHKEAILEKVNILGLDGITRRIALALLYAAPAEMWREIMRLPVLDVMKDADVSVAELESSFGELTLVRSIKSNSLARKPHAVLQNVSLVSGGTMLCYRICPGMCKVFDN